jgi:hypothetical protein
MTEITAWQQTLNQLQQGLASALGTRPPIDTNNPGLNQTKYNFHHRAFPEDLGSSQNSHYLVININVPVNASDQVRGAYYRAQGEGGNFTSTVLRGEYSKVDNLRFGRNDPSPISNISNNNPETLDIFGLPAITSTIGGQSELLAPVRGTRRIVESIALYMPSPMIYNQLNVYEDVSLTSIMGQAGKLAVGEVGKLVGAATAAATLRSIQAARQGNAAGGRLVNVDGTIIGTAFALAGYPINPRIEVLFSNTTQRQFNFEFLMAPRSEKESLTMKEIIKTLRFHAAPEIQAFTLGNTNFGVPTFIPPADFDITFYNGSSENLNIPRINTCILERCEVDYAPTGVWSTFTNGEPVAARLSLAFRELEIVHKRRVVQGF